jgi:hypothetical protein
MPNCIVCEMPGNYSKVGSYFACRDCDELLHRMHWPRDGSQPEPGCWWRGRGRLTIIRARQLLGCMPVLQEGQRIRYQYRSGARWYGPWEFEATVQAVDMAHLRVRLVDAICTDRPEPDGRRCSHRDRWEDLVDVVGVRVVPYTPLPYYELPALPAPTAWDRILDMMEDP